MNPLNGTAKEGMDGGALPSQKLRVNGFTLVELLVTLALIGLAASTVLPLASVIEVRSKESELRRSLRQIRQALDDYKAAADAGAIDKPTGSSGYPPSLDVLVTGVKRSSALGFSATPMVFLRSVPRDPFFVDQSTPAIQTWNVRGYGRPAGDFGAAGDVFDISSKSEKRALNGTVYKDW